MAAVELVAEVADSAEAVYESAVASTKEFAVVEQEAEEAAAEVLLTIDAAGVVGTQRALLVLAAVTVSADGTVDWDGIGGEMFVFVIDVVAVGLAEAVEVEPCLLLSDSCCYCCDRSAAMFGYNHSGRPVFSVVLDCMLAHL